MPQRYKYMPYPLRTRNWPLKRSVTSMFQRKETRRCRLHPAHNPCAVFFGGPIGLPLPQPETKRQGDQTAGAAAAAKNPVQILRFSPVLTAAAAANFRLVSKELPTISRKPTYLRTFWPITYETQVFAKLLFCEELIDIFLTISIERG